MTRFAEHSFAAIAAVLIATVSIGTIVTVPPAQANETTVQLVELA